MRSLAAATPRNQLHAFLDRAWGQGTGRREPGPTRSTIALTFVPYSLSNAAAAVAASKRGMWPQDWGQYSHCVWGLSAELPNVSRQDFLGRHVCRFCRDTKPAFAGERIEVYHALHDEHYGGGIWMYPAAGSGVYYTGARHHCLWRTLRGDCPLLGPREPSPTLYTGATKWDGLCAHTSHETFQRGASRGLRDVTVRPPHQSTDSVRSARGASSSWI